MSQSCVSKNLRKKDAKYFKRKKASKYTKKQMRNIRKIKTVLKTKAKFLVFNDKKYFTFSNTVIAGNSRFLPKTYK